MRVALLSRSAHPLHDPGGMERAVYLLAKHLRSRGGKLALCNPSPIVREIITLARFDKLFPIVESRSAAMHAVGAE